MIPSVPEPANHIQRKIKEMISLLAKSGGTSQSSGIYKILEDFFPFMSDEDMYFVDKILKVQGGESARVGTFPVVGIRLGVVYDKRDDLNLDFGEMSYTRCRSTQFSEWDNSYKGRSLVLAAIKLLNPNYIECGTNLKRR